MLWCWAVLVKFSCGCNGFLGLSDKALVVSACDGGRDDPEVGLFWRDLSDKEHEPLEPERAKELLDEMSSLVGDGHRYREIRSLLSQ